MVWRTVELREVRVFLTLAEELHFGRTAERLGITQSRVSQSLRELELKLGGELIRRTSRRAELTAVGVRLRAGLEGPLAALEGALEATHDESQQIRGVVRLGASAAAAVSVSLLKAISAFEGAHPDCTVQIVELPFADRFGPLSRGEVDVMAARLPLEQDDLVVGPVLERQGRVLAVARDHPLADRKEISIEEMVQYEVPSPEGVFPSELGDAFIPPRTPKGLPIRRSESHFADVNELIVAIARGKLVFPTVTQFAEQHGHPGLTYIPISDLPESEKVLAWRRRDKSPALQALLETVHQQEGQ